MHEADDVPMMSERGTSVSPGLYSFIAVETTEVQNLAPPWGTCGSSKLKYYDSYSIARCTLECETEFVRERCGCRDLHMPEVDCKNLHLPASTSSSVLIITSLSTLQSSPLVFLSINIVVVVIIVIKTLSLHHGFSTFRRHKHIVT